MCHKLYIGSIYRVRDSWVTNKVVNIYIEAVTYVSQTIHWLYIGSMYRVRDSWVTNCIHYGGNAKRRIVSSHSRYSSIGSIYIEFVTYESHSIYIMDAMQRSKSLAFTLVIHKLVPHIQFVTGIRFVAYEWRTVYIIEAMQRGESLALLPGIYELVTRMEFVTDESRTV